MNDDDTPLEERFNALPAIERLAFAWRRWIYCVQTLARMRNDPCFGEPRHFTLCKEMRDHWRKVVFEVSEEVMFENHSDAIVLPLTHKP